MTFAHAVGLSTLVAAAAAVVLRARADTSLVADARIALRRRSTWAVGVPVLAFVFLAGGPFLYLQSIGNDNPPPLTFDSLDSLGAPVPATPAPAPTVPATTPATFADAAAGGAPVAPPPTTGRRAATTTTATPSAAPAGATPAITASPVAGGWKVGAGSEARYGIDDVILGQKTRVVGRTPDVTGTMTITETAVSAVQVTVNMRTVVCHCSHDGKYQELLETDRFPTSTFVLGVPIPLSDIPAEGVEAHFPVTGVFTIHGVAHEERFTLAAKRIGGRIALLGSIPIDLADYDIDQPGNAAGKIDNPTIDVLLAFDRA